MDVLSVGVLCHLVEPWLSKLIKSFRLLNKQVDSTQYFQSPATEWGGDYRNARPSVSLSGRLSVAFRVRSITYVCIDGLPSNLLQMLSALRWCTVTLTRIHISKVKVTQDIVRCYKTGTHFPSIFSTKKPWH